MCLNVCWHPKVCVCVREVCQRNQSDESVKKWGSGMEKGRERKDEMKRKINSYVKERRQKERHLGRRESYNYISFLISLSKMPNVNVTKHTCLVSPNASFPPSPTHPWSCLLRPPTSLFLCGAAGQRARPAAARAWIWSTAALG